MKHKRLTTLLCLVTASGMYPACIRKVLPVSAPAQIPKTATPAVPADPLPYPAQFGLTGTTAPSPRTALGSRLNDVSLHDLYVALAACECLPALQTRLVTSINEFRGALPQALTPAVRKEILDNPQLKILNVVPRPLDNIVGGLFADEQKISEEISQGLLEKIKPAETTWAAQPTLPVLQLDSFVPLPATNPSVSGRMVRMIDVFTRWALVLGSGGPWSPERAASKDAGLLWHELLRSLAEAEYLFGLAGSENGSSWGGLTIPVDLQINNPGPFDPRKAYNQVRFLTGELNLTLNSNVSLTLARFGGERWNWQPASVTLAEQAVQWWVSAKLLNRLRPLNRGAFTTYFPALIPEESYQISLLVLPALEALLTERFIDEKSRAVRSFVDGELVGGNTLSVREKADPQTLSLFLMALAGWSRELKTVSDLNVSAETAKQLKSAPPSLLRAAQLVVQKILGEISGPVQAKANETPEQAQTLYINPRDPSAGEMSLRDHAQVLYALTIAETSVMPSAYLRDRIALLAAGFLRRMRENNSFDATKDPAAPQIWTKAAADALIKFYPDLKAGEELKTLAKTTGERLLAFEKGILQ
ncbi:MAG: hypothetical protein EBR09_02125 [Proteobacteria bacterium]|nr:hypothetical protein [Pseudomonadota bacterium]